MHYYRYQNLAKSHLKDEKQTYNYDELIVLETEPGGVFDH